MDKKTFDDLWFMGFLLLFGIAIGINIGIIIG
jgi:hypothetical protein